MLYSIQDTNIDTEEHKVQPFLSIINPKIFPFWRIIQADLWNTKQHCQSEDKYYK